MIAVWTTTTVFLIEPNNNIEATPLPLPEIQIKYFENPEVRILSFFCMTIKDIVVVFQYISGINGRQMR